MEIPNSGTSMLYINSIHKELMQIINQIKINKIKTLLRSLNQISNLSRVKKRVILNFYQKLDNCMDLVYVLLLIVLMERFYSKCKIHGKSENQKI